MNWGKSLVHSYSSHQHDTNQSTITHQHNTNQSKVEEIMLMQDCFTRQYASTCRSPLLLWAHEDTRLTLGYIAMLYDLLITSSHDWLQGDCYGVSSSSRTLPSSSLT